MRQIDADALTQNIHEDYCKNCDNANGIMCKACLIDDAIFAIDDAPTINSWISCAERMPEDGQDVIGCDSSGFVTRFKYCADDPPCWVDDHEEFFLKGEIIAWMPLPDPPEKE